MKSLLTGLVPRLLTCVVMLFATVGFSGCGGGDDAGDGGDATSTDTGGDDAAEGDTETE